MKPYEIIKDIFMVGGPEITDSRDGCAYLINLGELILIDSGAGWSSDHIIDNIRKLKLPKQSTDAMLGGNARDLLGM